MKPPEIIMYRGATRNSLLFCICDKFGSGCECPPNSFQERMKTPPISTKLKAAIRTAFHTDLSLTIVFSSPLSDPRLNHNAAAPKAEIRKRNSSAVVGQTPSVAAAPRTLPSMEVPTGAFATLAGVGIGDKQTVIALGKSIVDFHGMTPRKAKYALEFALTPPIPLSLAD